MRTGPRTAPRRQACLSSATSIMRFCPTCESATEYGRMSAWPTAPVGECVRCERCARSALRHACARA